MNRNTIKALTLFTTLAIVLAAAPHANAGKAVKFFGTAQAVAESGVDVTGFACFQAPLLDLATGRVVGTGVDCLNPFDTAGDAAGEGLQIEAKTFFFFKKGLVVNHGCTSVRPVFAGVGDAGVTHITGSIPAEEFGADAAPIPACDEAGGVILTTGGFRGASGAVRLSGAVNLSNAGAGEITFSCIFVLDLEPFGSGGGGE
jgi:hypothetical protein